MKYTSSNQSGFSLVETLVAVTILLLIIIGPMTISSATARSTSFSSEQVMAFFLAQEGAEIAQKARDDKLLKRFLATGHSDYDSTPWTTFTSGSGYADCFRDINADGCGLELDTDTIGSIKTPIDCTSTGADCKLYFDDSGNERANYTHVSGGIGGNEATPYTRVIKFDHDSSFPDQVGITSTVTWRTGSQRKEQQVVVETYLFNVYGN